MPRIELVEDLGSLSLAAFDDIIDVRSPSEFAEDHIPGAINLPVLDDGERASVGTLYVQESKFRARRLGAALVTKNISNHLQTILSTKSASYRPLIYCWRGGMRSNAMATILSSIGWRVSVVTGGYKSWRRLVVDALRTNSEILKIVLLDGQTGTAKTAILKKLEDLGVQTLDLEGLANHRGSVFGAKKNAPQPSQKMFESLIWRQLSQFDLTRHIVVEAESKIIGRRALPTRLVTSMQAAGYIEIQCDLKTQGNRLNIIFP